MTVALTVWIFDDVVAARGETFHIAGVDVSVHGHADDAVAQLRGAGKSVDVIFMDHAMGRGRKTGTEAIRALRQAGFSGRIVAISSDPAANAEMRGAGADEALTKKALLRSYLVHLGGGPPDDAS